MAILVASCIFGERLDGPTINVRNELAGAVVVQVRSDAWTVNAGELRVVTVMSPQASTAQVSVTVLEDCARSGNYETAALLLSYVGPEGEYR